MSKTDDVLGKLRALENALANTHPLACDVVNEAANLIRTLQADAQRKAYPHAAQLLTNYANQMEKELGEEPFHAGGYVVSDRVKELRAAANALSVGQ